MQTTEYHETEPIEQDRLLYRLVLVYIALWIFEGALRRWILPQYSNPLLLVRDPLAIAVYIVASSIGRFPVNTFIYACAALAVLEILSVPFGHGDVYVAAFGLRSDFLHVPMIFIIGQTFTRQRLLVLCRIAVILSIPYTMLLVSQYYSPQSAWVNRGLGGSLLGAGYTGTGDKFRPPGTFSFITGPACLYPMFTACWFVFIHEFKDERSKTIGFASALAILLAVPMSISRSLAISVGLVAIAGMLCLIPRGRLNVTPQTLIFILAAVFFAPFATQFKAVNDSLTTFGNRWAHATTSSGGVQEAILGRVYSETIGVLLNPNIPALGAGTGFSSNVGQKLVTSRVGFGNSEGEFGRLMLDNGILTGGLLVLFRILLTVNIGIIAINNFGRDDLFGLAFFVAAMPMVFNSQWAQTTAQGGATIAAGLCVAASVAFRRESEEYTGSTDSWHED